MSEVNGVGNSFLQNLMKDVKVRVIKGYMGNFKINNNNDIEKSFQLANAMGAFCDEFVKMDRINQDGNINYDEYEAYYLESNSAKNLSKEDLKKLKQEAKNMFDAMADEEGNISAERYGKVIRVLDEADGIFDGSISDNTTQRLEYIKEEGPETSIFNGRSLGEMIDSMDLRANEPNKAEEVLSILTENADPEKTKVKEFALYNLPAENKFEKWFGIGTDGYDSRTTTYYDKEGKELGSVTTFPLTRKVKDKRKITEYIINGRNGIRKTYVERNGDGIIDSYNLK